MVVTVKFSEFIKIQLLCLKVSGLDPLRDDNDKSWKSYLLNFYQHFFIVNLIICQLLGCVSIILRNNNVEVITRLMFSSLITFLSCVKSCEIFLKRKLFKDILESCEKLFPKNLEDQQKINLQRHFKSFKLVQKTFLGLAAFAFGILFAGLAYKIASTGSWLQKFPIEFVFPYDEYDPKYHAFTFIWLYGISIIASYIVLGADLLLYAFITLIIIQYDQLRFNIKRLDHVFESRFRNEVKQIVKLHTTLTKLANSLQELFAFSIFTNFFGSSLLLCVVGYQVAEGSNLENLILYWSLLVFSLVQVLLMCFHGQKLTDASEQVAEAALELKWHEPEGKRLKHVVQLMIIRSQSPSILSAFKFSKISLRAFVSVSSDQSRF